MSLIPKPMPNIIIIPLLPFGSIDLIPRFYGKQRSSDWTKYWNHETSFAEAGIASWQEWSSRHEVILEIATEIPSPIECGYTKSQIDELKKFPPTILRWLLPLASRKKHGSDSRIAMIDADTLVSPKSPSIFEQSHTDVLLTRDRPDLNQWRKDSLSAFEPIFPGFDFNKDMYFNAGVIVLENNKLPRAFLDFTLQHSEEFLSLINGNVGTDQTPLNFILQALVNNDELTVAFLDSRWNARIDLLLKAENPERRTWARRDSIAKIGNDLVQQNYISHFVSAKILMPAVWQFLKQTSDD